jgi:hypothetical protein
MAVAMRAKAVIVRYNVCYEVPAMTYKGHIKNGSVVLDEAVALPDGAEVTVDLVATRPPVPLAELLKDVIGKASGLPPDASSQKRHYLYGHPKS